MKGDNNMTIHSETALRNFGFWSGAKERADMLTSSQLDAIETELEQLYPDGIGETELNDLFWLRLCLLFDRHQ